MNRNPRSGQPYFNPNSLVPEPFGQVGNAMRRSFTGSGINNFDMALLKDSRISEAMRFEFRAEAFNLFNHAQFTMLTSCGGMPAGNINNTGVGGFGYVTAARDPRIIQLALKLLF